MPKAKIWKDPDALVKDLMKYWRKAQSALDTPSATDVWAHCGVGSNTFRAFPNMPQPPSKVFRTWAREALVTRGLLNELKSVRSQKEYDKWLGRLVNDLRRHWRRKMGCEMPFGPSFKLPNLLMKAVYINLPLRQRNRVRGFLHVAWDSYTLQGLRNCVLLPDGRKIPMNATMGFVHDMDVYEDLQDKLRRLAKKAGVPAISYDYLAWNATH